MQVRMVLRQSAFASARAKLAQEQMQTWHGSLPSLVDRQ